MEIALPFSFSAKDYFALCKPKVVTLMLVTAWVGMIMASKNAFSCSLKTFSFATVGIGLAAFGSAVFNHLADRHIDAKMLRTSHRPIARGRISPKKAFLFGFILVFSGLLILKLYVNAITAVLTFFTTLGYALCYTLFLKRVTPQNIVIGGLAGATPPLLGWTAVTGEIHNHALLLVLIIFTWTPPHFWALAIHRCHDYEKAGIPMLPVTHGIQYTKLCIFLYTCLLLAVSLLPFATGLCGRLYFSMALVLGILFLKQSFTLLRDRHHQTAMETFSFSIVYLLLLFTALLMDHFCYV